MVHKHVLFSNSIFEYEYKLSYKLAYHHMDVKEDSRASIIDHRIPLKHIHIGYAYWLVLLPLSRAWRFFCFRSWSLLRKFYFKSTRVNYIKYSWILEYIFWKISWILLQKLSTFQLYIYYILNNSYSFLNH